MIIKSPSRFTPCTIELPPSKSVANRAIVLSCLYGNTATSEIIRRQFIGQPACDDIHVMQNLTDRLTLDTDFFVEASGTAMRFGTALMAVTEGTRTITGTERLCQRPISPLVDALRALGAEIEYLGEEGYPPLRIKGNPRMQGGELTIRGDISSQFVSALLMIAPKFIHPLILNIEGDLVSQPYISMTLQMMARSFAVNPNSSIRLASSFGTLPIPSVSPLPTFSSIEPDWSAAAFWYEMNVLSGVEFDLSGLDFDSVQGDCVCHEIFGLLLNEIRIREDKSEEALPFEYDFTLCPDLVQAVVVTCSMKHIPFRFTGLRTLRIKETDRISALQTELLKMGFVITATSDTMTWDGTIQESSTIPALVSIATYNDHRMAMAFAPCAILLGEINIENPEVVTKSYPTFWDDIKKAGMIIK